MIGIREVGKKSAERGLGRRANLFRYPQLQSFIASTLKDLAAFQDPGNKLLYGSVGQCLAMLHGRAGFETFGRSRHTFELKGAPCRLAVRNGLFDVLSIDLGNKGKNDGAISSRCTGIIDDGFFACVPSIANPYRYLAAPLRRRLISKMNPQLSGSLLLPWRSLIPLISLPQASAIKADLFMAIAEASLITLA